MMDDGARNAQFCRGGLRHALLTGAKPISESDAKHTEPGPPKTLVALCEVTNHLLFIFNL